MSNAIFPMLPGLAWSVKRSPGYSSRQQRSASGATTSAEFYSAPLTKWSFQYEFLRRGQGHAEVDAVMAFFRSHRGKHDSFLLRDPEDYAVTSMGFGVGNGTTLTFQLQRAIAGTFVRNGQYGASQALPTKARTNLVTNSQNAAAWTSSFAGTGVAPVKTADWGVAPDGSLTADRIILDIAGGTTGADVSMISAAGYVTTIGQTYCVSVWMRSNEGINRAVRVDHNSTGNSYTVTPMWQRFSFTFVSTNTASHNIRILLFGTSPTDKYADISVWGGQVEAGSTPTDYIATTTAAVTVSPAYWPASADGFEPVYTVDQSARAVAIYERDWLGNDVLLSPYPRTNACNRSAEMNLWTAANLGTGLAPVITANALAAPDGTTTADRIVLDRGAGTGAGDYSLIYSLGNTLVVGKTYTASIWLRTWASSATLRITMLNVSGVTQDAALDTSWRKFTITFVATNATSNRIELMTQGNLPSSTICDFVAWGAMIEDGPVAGRYIPTTTAAVTATDYVLSNSGLVTFTVAPPLNAQLSWTGDYFWRVGFTIDAADTEQFMENLYNWKKVEMETRR